MEVEKKKGFGCKWMTCYSRKLPAKGGKALVIKVRQNVQTSLAWVLAPPSRISGASETKELITSSSEAATFTQDTFARRRVSMATFCVEERK